MAAIAGRVVAFCKKAERISAANLSRGDAHGSSSSAAAAPRLRKPPAQARVGAREGLARLNPCPQRSRPQGKRAAEVPDPAGSEIV
jgi:hypothetical protein